MKLTPEKYCQFLSKLPITERKWSNIEPSKTKSGRKRILEKYGPYAFLDPENLKYPIISRKGEFSPKGLLAAYKRARQWGDDKIAALAEQIGKCMGLSWALLNPSQIQSFLFDRTFWTLKSARKWLKEHGFEYHNYERTPNYYRFPQQKPEKFIKFRTKDFGNGIKAIIGFKDLISNPNEPYNSNMATLKDVVEELRKLRKEYEITRKELGKVTRSLSNIPEGFTKEAILQALKTVGFRNAKLISFGEVALPGVEDWADAWLTARKKGKEWVFYIEIKTTARPEDINEFVNSIKEVQKQKEFKNKKVQGIFAAVKFENAYKKQALKKGLWIMIPSEKGMKIEKP